VVEGKRDKEALRALGFEGPIELINRGWDRSRLVAYFYDTYGTRNTIDGGPPLMLLMDWDRTGGRIQTTLRDRLNSLDVPIDENLRKVLLRTMKPEGKTVEALAPFAKTLRPLIEAQMDIL
jgi:5S rRNA maturation endonuclease (ribonuclease M5)